MLKPFRGHCALVATLATLAWADAVAQEWPVPTHADIVYAVVDGRELALDLHLPAGAERPPLLVWVHGGAWQRRSKVEIRTAGLVDHGFAIASIDFRNSVDAPFPAQINDIKAAIRFLRAKADDYGYDANRIGIHGSSSGGHLAALVGVSNGNAVLEGKVGAYLDQSSDIDAIVSYYGASNLRTILDQYPATSPYRLERQEALELLFAGPLEDRWDLAALASPVTHVDASDPPLLLLHGDQDPDIPIDQAYELHGRYEDAGLVVQFEVLEGAGHGGDLFYDAKRTALVAEFLKRNLR